MNIYESKYVKMDYCDENGIFELTWLPASEDMTDEDYKVEHKEFLRIILDNKVEKVLGNVRDLAFVVNPDLQEWMNENIFIPIIKAGSMVFGLVASEQLISQLSIEQLMDEEIGKQIPTKYFSDRDEAKNWLLNSIDDIAVEE